MLIISATKDRAEVSRTILMNLLPSRMDGKPLRNKTVSVPSGEIKTGLEPVVLAAAARPDALSTPAMRRVTLDFPLVPVTQMRKGIFFNRRIF